ncbi:MAG: GH36 C-terminal domain-containing protein [Verrucomicrobia bacterium]|nr:GH36 C-terminal domain-containing protein [Verrucomicrobiota bacterium]
MKMMKTTALLLMAGLLAGAALAEEPASITANGKVWTLRNDTLQASVSFAEGKLRMDSLLNLAANVDYLKGQAAAPLFTHQIGGVAVAADDGAWTLEGATTKAIELYGKPWGQRLEITLSRTKPVAFSTRHVLEIYHGRAALRYFSYVKNGTDKEVTINASEVFDLNPPEQPRKLHFVEGFTRWNSSPESLTRGGRNCLVRYDDGHGLFVLLENNWATSLEPGGFKGLASEKMLYVNAWPQGAQTQGPKLSVATNPKAVQLVLFPGEEVEYFSVNVGVFQGDALDGRVAVAEHLRKRFKFHDPTHQLSANDWIWYNKEGRTDAKYRDIVVPKVAAAGFDRIHIDDIWYAPEDGCEPKDGWTSNMPALCEFIMESGMKPGHWFSLQGKYCYNGWGDGRDCADPANIDFKLKQLEETLIGKYHTAWDQVDAGLLWKTDALTTYSHPSDSVYRKILGLHRYMNTITHKYPDFMMQVTCEIDNPAKLNDCVGLIHLADNGIVGMFRRTDTRDDVRDLLDCVGTFPLEGLLSTWGEDGSATAWQDTPLWYYQFLLARHTTIYPWPGDWSTNSVAHLRAFNEWRKNPRFKAVLNELLRPVYNGADWQKNEGPWSWMFTDEKKIQALLFAINHLKLSNENAFAAKLRWLDPAKTYLIEDITMLSGGKFKHRYCGAFSGAQLKENGLPIDLNAGPERCAAFWIQEQGKNVPQVLYADAAVTSYTEKIEGSDLTVTLEGTPGAMAQLVSYQPGAKGVEDREVTLDSSGKVTVVFDSTTISNPAKPAGFQ